MVMVSGPSSGAHWVKSHPQKLKCHGTTQKSTIFDEKQNPVAQRLFFVNPKNLNLDQPTLNFSLNNESRAFNSFDIEPDEDYTNYTVLVREKQPSDNINENNLLTTVATPKK